jgi:uncharacterized protein (DUF58 family)
MVGTGTQEFMRKRLKAWAAERWRRMRQWLKMRVRERVTRAGALFIAASVMVGLAAFLSANNLLFLLLAAMLSTLMVSGFVSRLGLSGLELDVLLPDHVCARQPAQARVLLKNEKRWMPSFSLHLSGVENSVFSGSLYFPVAPGGAVIEETMEVRFHKRGVHREDSFQFSSRFPFGFAERRMRVTMRRDVIVYPALEAKPGFDDLLAGVQGEAESLFRGRGHDFYRIRPYEPFESARHVDWRATAHTGELQVREFAREQEHLISLALDLEAGPEHEAWFEEAVEACAYLAWRLAAQGARVRFRTQDFDVLTPLEGDVYDILRYLAVVERRRRAEPLAPLMEESAQVLFTARRADPAESSWVGARIVGPDALLGAKRE